MPEHARTDKLFYFSYGSNMSTARLQNRIASAVPVTVGWTGEHRLRFHKRGRDGSGKCDIEFTRQERDRVFGVVFEIAASDKLILDRFEGLGNGYDDKRIIITTAQDHQVEVVTYFATHIDASLKPFGWYKEHVLRGMREHALPAYYIAATELIESIADWDRERHQHELAIYR
jgi:hypothetical protein